MKRLRAAMPTTHARARSPRSQSYRGS
jgi:hypothetical protein